MRPTAHTPKPRPCVFEIKHDKDTGLETVLSGTERVNYSEETMNQSSSEIKRGASMFQAGVSCPVLNDPGGGIVHRSSVCLGIVCHGPACSNRTSPAPRSRRKGRAQVRGEGGRKKGSCPGQGRRGQKKGPCPGQGGKGAVWGFHFKVAPLVGSRHLGNRQIGAFG